MPMTDPQGAALAQLLHQIRRDWPIPSLIAHLKSHADHPASFGDIAQAAITTANERDAKTPLLIWDQGSHWPERIRERIPQGPRCEAHREELAATCRSCRGDVLAGERTEDQVGKRLNPGKPIPASQASIARHGDRQNMPQDGPGSHPGATQTPTMGSYSSPSFLTQHISIQYR